MAPPEKKQKTDAEAAPEAGAEPAAEAAKKEEKPKPEPPKELEEDAKASKDPRIKDTVQFLTPDTTLNVMRSTIGNMLVPLSEGGLSQLVGGARANVGVKSGRYMFEVKILEQPWSNGGNMARVGFSTDGSLYLGEDEHSICFDAGGFIINNKKSTRGSQTFARGNFVAVVLNLDDKSPNFNTISLFKDGKRACQPHPLPEALKGKTLFPAVSFKNCTMHLNFATPAVPLPFTCRGVQDASAKESAVKKYDEPSDGKYSVLFPVSLPDEGTFDWLDSFLEKNPTYTELSDRAFTEWASKSGLKAKGRAESNDKPGVASLDDIANVKKTLMDIAALQPRNFVIMEVRSNLIKADREAALAKFKSGNFKTVAEVVIGETPAGFKKIVEAKVLKAKQDSANREHRVKHIEAKKQWTVRKKTKEAEKAKKKKEKELKKKAEEQKKKLEEAKKKAAKEAEKKKAEAEGKEPPAEEEEEEKAEEEPAAESEEEPEEPEEPEPEETEPPTVSLDAEEKATKFFKHPAPDMTPSALAAAFTKFSLPEDDGFDQVTYSWAKQKDAAAYLKKWILDKKQVTPLDDIKPSDWFKQKASKWKSESERWKNKQNDYRNMLSKKAAAKRAKLDRKLAAEKKAKLEAEKKAKEAEEKAKAAAEGKEEEKKEEEVKEEEKAPVVEEAESEPEVEIDFDGIDVFGVQDIMDIGGQAPLFRDFQFEDFALMALRFELNLLVHAFAKDCPDPDRTGIPLDHLSHYYNKYYGKPLHLASFGAQTAAELVALVDDTIAVNKDNIMEGLVPVEVESEAVFCKMTEAARRHRHLRVDMGDESAKLKVRKEEQKKSWGEKGAGVKGGFKGGFKGSFNGGVKGGFKDGAKGGFKDAGKNGSKGAFMAKGAPIKGKGKDSDWGKGMSKGKGEGKGEWRPKGKGKGKEKGKKW